MRVTVPTTLICPSCHTHLQIFRLKGRQRKPGHIKHMWCFKCKEIQGFIEQAEFNFEGVDQNEIPKKASSD